MRLQNTKSTLDPSSITTLDQETMLAYSAAPDGLNRTRQQPIDAIQSTRGQIVTGKCRKNDSDNRCCMCV